MKYLILLLFLIIQITAFSTDKKKKLVHDKNKAITNMNEELDNFDNETDEEALQKLKKKTKDKSKDESVTHPTKSVTHPAEATRSTENKEVNKSSDTTSKGEAVTRPTTYTNVNAEKYQQESKDNQSYTNTNNSNQNEENNNIKKDKKFKMALTLGGGIKIDSFDYHASQHLGGEILAYKIPDEGFMLSGLSFGFGFTQLDIYEPYVSVAYSAMFLPISSSWGPFLRFDAGVMFWDDDILKTDEEIEKDGDTPPLYVGLLLKAGGGFLVGNETNGVSVQLLYTIHATTLGTNDGVELQVGLHF